MRTMLRFSYLRSATKLIYYTDKIMELSYYTGTVMTQQPFALTTFNRL